MLFLLWTVSFFVGADPRDQFAQETGLDRDLVNLVKVEVGGTELTVTFVFINERTLQSRISAELAATLRPYIGQNAIYVNPSIDAVVNRFDFDPRQISVDQNGVILAPSIGSWHEITIGFLAGQFVVNPSGPSQGSGSEGVLILGDSIDSQSPFSVQYAGQWASFAIGETPIAASAVGSPTASV